MYIVPISSSFTKIEGLKPLGSESASQGTSGSQSVGFKDIFQEAVKNVEQTEAATQEDAYNLSIGKLDDVHSMMINAAKADLALQTMVQLRNKMIDAYQEVMRTNL